MKKLHLIIIVIVLAILVGVGLFAGPDDETNQEATSSEVEGLPVNDGSSPEDSSSLVPGELLEEGEDNSAETSSLVPGELPQEEAADGEVHLTISMTNFEFSTSTINANPGDNVVINLNSESGVHNFAVDELGINSNNLSGGENEQIEFTIPADAAGKTYEFYCAVGSHRALGMVGSLVIGS